MDSPEERKSRSQYFYASIALALFVIGAVLLWALRALVVPFLFGAIAAYLVIPLVRLLERYGLPRMVAILTLFLMFSILVYQVGVNVGEVIGDEKRTMDWRVIAEFKINKYYQSLMGLDPWGKGGNSFYRSVGKESDKAIDKINDILFLPKDLRARYQWYRKGYHNLPRVSDRVWEYHLTNVRYYTGRMGIRKDLLAQEGRTAIELGSETELVEIITFTEISELISVWVVTPMVFLFLLFDNGRGIRHLIGFSPNRFFEISHNVISDVNKAIGNYLRGTFLQCSLLGITLGILLLLIGVDPRWVFIISGVVALTNVIPFLGPFMGLICAVGYSLVAEEIVTPLPFVTFDMLMFWMVVSVFLVQILDNLILQPFVLGRAVRLHPFIVVMGVVAGSLSFGFAGLLLAIPSIVVVREILGSLNRQLKAYYLI